MTPDQPTGMNKLRGIFNAYAISLHKYSNGRGKPDDYTVQTAKAVAAVQQIVERSLPAKWELYGDAKSLSYHEALGFHQAIDQFRHKLQQAGLLRGDEDK